MYLDTYYYSKMELAHYVPEGLPRQLYTNYINQHQHKFNQHTYDVLRVISKLSYCEIDNCPDQYIRLTFYSTPLTWLLKIDDPDFQDFIRQSKSSLDEITLMPKEDAEFIKQIIAIIIPDI